MNGLQSFTKSSRGRNIERKDCEGIDPPISVHDSGQGHTPVEGRVGDLEKP